VANRITDGFDWMPSGLSAAERERLWGANNFFPLSGTATADVALGRFDFGNALSWDVAAQNGLHGYVMPIGAHAATSYFGGALFIHSDASNGVFPTLAVYDGVADIAHVWIQFAANGVIKIFDGTGTLLANSDPGAFQEDEWFHFEIKTLVATSGGTCEVRINTVPWVQLVGANTQAATSAYADCVMIGYRSTSVASPKIHFEIDDVFVNDDTGSENNTWSGNLRVKTQFMIANGATDNFTIGGTSPAATHWQSVLNGNMDDTKFEYSSTIGNIDLFTPDPNLNSPLVRTVQVRMGLRQDDATQRMAHGMLRISGTNYEGTTDQYTNQTYTFYKQRWELNPATGVSFTGAEVNGLQAGVKLVA
jgi:hypothetical protein